MSKRMLIDAAHPEETRVVILSGNRVEEFDFESASRKPLKGNIYLAKVTRVEPSLQAAFIEYGGNRHGFLAFSEIHPDYYQIPVADRQALIAAQRAEERSERARDDAREAASEAGHPPPDAPVPPPTQGAEDPLPTHAAMPGEDEAILANGFDAAPIETATESEPAAFDSPTAPQALQEEPDAAEAPGSQEDAPEEEHASYSNAETGHDDESSIEEIVVEPVEAEEVSSGEEDALDEVEERRPSHRMRHYKIQEVIKKRQILLIQVVKEERGNKGAALTTYLSLAGRYCVLMPNSGRGGGISRKITNTADRRRLKDAAEALDVPDGMGLIVRTAGASRTKQEIHRDYEYLLRLWDSIRDLTLRSSAPALVYEEGNLIKRALRDQFSRDIEEVVVEGEEAYEEAQTFIKMLMPQQAEAVKQHHGPPPLLQKYKVESQLDSMFNPRVQLRSGGYIIINQTEALVAVDVNSGRSTREHNIEDTALKTNLEAAEEVARQLRLRDLAGLIVIDFIDMEEHRNNRAVERKIKDCLRNDRARIQLGRISPFGLLEMSRQRLRPGMVEGSTVACPHCNGTGLIRSVESLALRALRNVEEEAANARAEGVTVRLPTEVAVYLLNHKRSDIAAMEERLGIAIFVEAKHDMFGADCEVELGAPSGMRTVRRVSHATAVSAETALSQMPDAVYEEAEEENELAGDGSNIEEVGEPAEAREGGPRRERDERGGRRGGRRRRSGRDGGRDGERGPRGETPSRAEPLPAAVAAEGIEDASEGADEAVESGEIPAGRPSERDGGDRRRRRRGRRGGRRNGREGFVPGEGEAAVASAETDETGAATGEYELEPVPMPGAAQIQETAKQRPAGAAAAIARFFGFRAKSETPEDANPAPAPRSEIEPAAGAGGLTTVPAPTSPAPEEQRAPAPAAEEPAPVRTPRSPRTRKPEAQVEAPRDEQPAEVFVAAHDPVPVVDAPVPEIAEALHEPEPDVHMAPPSADSPPTLAYIEAEAPPAPTGPIVAPPVDENVEIVVIGEAPSGPAKAGWWKKREG